MTGVVLLIYEGLVDVGVSVSKGTRAILAVSSIT